MQRESLQTHSTLPKQQIRELTLRDKAKLGEILPFQRLLNPRFPASALSREAHHEAILNTCIVYSLGLYFTNSPLPSA